MTGACSFVVCKLGSCCVHSSAPQFDRSLREGAPCATLSMLTYYRTSRSLHFPFWAVCSLSGAQPEIWSVGWNPPVHRIAFRLFVAFPFNPRPSSSAPPEGEGAPGSSGPVHSGRHTAQEEEGEGTIGKGKGGRARVPFSAKSWGYSAFQYSLPDLTPKTNRCASRFATTASALRASAAPSGREIAQFP